LFGCVGVKVQVEKIQVGYEKATTFEVVAFVVKRKPPAVPVVKLIA